MLQCCYLLLYRHLLSARQLISNSCYCCCRIANSSCVSVSLRCESTLVQGGWLLRRLLALPTTLPSTYIVARSGMNNVTYRHWRNTPLIWLNTPNTSTWIADKYADIHFFFLSWRLLLLAFIILLLFTSSPSSIVTDWSLAFQLFPVWALLAQVLVSKKNDSVEESWRCSPCWPSVPFALTYKAEKGTHTHKSGCYWTNTRRSQHPSINNFIASADKRKTRPHLTNG